MAERAHARTFPPGEPGDKPRIAPVVIPHGLCGPSCPWCPPAGRAADTDGLMPTADDVAHAVRQLHDRRGSGPGPALLALYGGSLGALPFAARATLLDAAEREFRSARVDGIRVVCDPPRLLRMPLGEWRLRGVRSLEVPLLSMDPRVLRAWGCEAYPAMAERVVHKARWLGLEVGLQLVPGLPGDSHAQAVETARAVAALAPDHVRLLPALALSGTRLERWWRDGDWTPMSVAQAVDTCTAMVDLLRAEGVAVARIGLQPEFDLARGPDVLAGPYHPSLRHLVETGRFRAMALRQARSLRFARSVQLRFHPSDESYLRGHANATIRELTRALRSGTVELAPDPALPRGTLCVEERP